MCKDGRNGDEVLHKSVYNTEPCCVLDTMYTQAHVI